MLEQRKKDIQMYTGLINDVKQRLADGVLQDCFAKHLLDEQANLGMTDLEIAYTAGSPFGAGVETVRDPDSSSHGIQLQSSNAPPVSWLTRKLPVGLRQVWRHLYPSSTGRVGQGGREPQAADI